MAKQAALPIVKPKDQDDRGNDAQTRLLYSYIEARHLLGNVPQSTFALWIAKGLFHPVRIGPRRSFIRRDELLQVAGREVV